MFQWIWAGAAQPARHLVGEQAAAAREDGPTSVALHEAGQCLVVGERGRIDAIAGADRQLERLETRSAGSSRSSPATAGRPAAIAAM